ncbi:Uma2 family endonuclease [Pleurocapsa sp. PCC 7327]|uniref:Uma2 family endonuclease n=1 Tax=Pleurocapsa sp. PCC 7327 TaxID=118163 RepID=UPI0002DEAE39|nr:Uma2 family endonuclease [Pleurocapsa sp. PCC 7327]
MTAITLNFPPTARLSDEQFYQLCSANRDLRFERAATGELIIMPPTGGETSRQNSEIIIEYRIGQDKEVLDNPATLSGENVLLGFVLNLQAI